MQKSKTHFEQIPVAVVKRIAEEVHEDVVENDTPVTRISPTNVKLHRLAALRKNGKRT